MSKPIKVGVVGCGYWGPNLIRNFRTLPDCNLKLMCDLDEQRLQLVKHFLARFVQNGRISPEILEEGEKS